MMQRGRGSLETLRGFERRRRAQGTRRSPSMFTSIPSLDPILQCLLPAFTQPSFQTHVEVLLGWVMCLGKRTEYGVFQTIQADTPVSRRQRHPFDRFYNFFSRSAWTVHGLARGAGAA